MTASAKCFWCRSAFRVQFFRGRRTARCKCHDYRTPLEKRRDSVLNKYGDDPRAYTSEVLALLAAEGLLDITGAFCPAGKLSPAETKKREALQVSRA